MVAGPACGRRLLTDSGRPAACDPCAGLTFNINAALGTTGIVPNQCNAGCSGPCSATAPQTQCDFNPSGFSSPKCPSSPSLTPNPVFSCLAANQPSCCDSCAALNLAAGGLCFGPVGGGLCTAGTCPANPTAGQGGASFSKNQADLYAFVTVYSPLASTGESVYSIALGCPGDQTVVLP